MGTLTHQGEIPCLWPVRIKTPFNPFKIPTFRCSTPLEDPSGSSRICPTDDSHLIICIIPTNGWSYRWLNMMGPISLYVFSTHVSLYGNNLYTMPKDPTTRLYLPCMGRAALRSWSLNSKSSLQGKLLGADTRYKPLIIRMYGRKSKKKTTQSVALWMEPVSYRAWD